jgi:hypothetical protein
MAFQPFRLIQSLHQRGLRFLSTVPKEREVVTFLRLNNLTDNPGAVKIVSCICVCVRKDDQQLIHWQYLIYLYRHEE